MVDRLCQIMDEGIETEILDEALFSVVRKCGKLEELIDAAVVGLDEASSCPRMERDTLRKVLHHRFREGQCSDFEL